MKRILLISLLSIALGASAVNASSEECHAGFSAYAGVQPYILNPAVRTRSVAKIVSVFEDTEGLGRRTGTYSVTIRSVVTGQVVAHREGELILQSKTQAERIVTWDGRDDAGAFASDGEYEIVVSGATEEGKQAFSSPTRVVLDRTGQYDRLFASRGHFQPRADASAIDTSFPYQYFFGTTHAHTNWSDGGMPTTDCVSGRYGYAGGAQPVDAFGYAKTSGSVNFLAVVEHNHLMQDACTTCTSTQILSRYASGVTAAQNATVAGSFVGIFGMEWGVISGGGHVNVYNQNQLMSWVGEPYNVLTDKSNYSMLYTAMANNQGTMGSYGTFNHPNTGDFGNWARTADGDAVMRGLSIISGPAFNTSTSFSPGGSTYVSEFNLALSYGWKIAPEAHQDNHCWNYGNSTPNRTGALIPNGTTFSQQSLMSAYNQRRIYASQDRDVQLVYRTSDGAHVMGDTFSASGGVTVDAKLADPAGEGVQKIEIWGGKAGTPAAPGAAAALQASSTGSSSFTATLSPQTAGDTWYYYVNAVQADGDNVWSAPMWITWGAACTVPSTTALSSPADGATGVGTSPVLSWSAASGATSYDLYLGTATSPAFHSTTTSTSVTASGLTAGTTYYWRVVAKNSCGSGPTSATRSFTTAAATTPVTLISEGAESGATGWTFPKNTGSGWSIETTTDSYAGAKRFKTNVGYSTYLNGADWSVVSPAFSLAGKTSSTLTFYNKYKTESGYDFFRVEISTDGGSTWTQLRSVSGQSASYPAWAAQVSLSLNTYVGQSNVKVRFRFTSDSSVTDWGVALDEIVVTAQ